MLATDTVARRCRTEGVGAPGYPEREETIGPPYTDLPGCDGYEPGRARRRFMQRSAGVSVFFVSRAPWRSPLYHESPPAVAWFSHSIASSICGPGCHRRFLGLPIAAHTSSWPSPAESKSLPRLVTNPPMAREHESFNSLTNCSVATPLRPLRFKMRRNSRFVRLAFSRLMSLSGRPFFGGRPGPRLAWAGFPTDAGAGPFALARRRRCGMSLGSSQLTSTPRILTVNRFMAWYRSNPRALVNHPVALVFSPHHHFRKGIDDPQKNPRI